MNLGSIAKYGIKAAGAIGAGICLYDAHKEGKRQSEIYVKNCNANAALKWFDNSRNLHSPSNINAKLKDKIFNWETHNNIRAFFNSGIGYVKGFASMLFNDVVPVALSAAAIFTKGKTAPKVAGGALGAYGIYAFAKNVLGIGVSADSIQDKYI